MVSVLPFWCSGWEYSSGPLTTHCNRFFLRGNSITTRCRPRRSPVWPMPCAGSVILVFILVFTQMLNSDSTLLSRPSGLVWTLWMASPETTARLVCTSRLWSRLRASNLPRRPPSPSFASMTSSNCSQSRRRAANHTRTLYNQEALKVKGVVTGPDRFKRLYLYMSWSWLSI